MAFATFHFRLFCEFGSLKFTMTHVSFICSIVEKKKKKKTRVYIVIIIQIVVTNSKKI